MGLCPYISRTHHDLSAGGVAVHVVLDAELAVEALVLVTSTVIIRRLEHVGPHHSVAASVLLLLVLLLLLLLHQLVDDLLLLGLGGPEQNLDFGRRLPRGGGLVVLCKATKNLKMCSRRHIHNKERCAYRTSIWQASPR